MHLRAHGHRLSHATVRSFAAFEGLGQEDNYEGYHPGLIVCPSFWDLGRGIGCISLIFIRLLYKDNWDKIWWTSLLCGSRIREGFTRWRKRSMERQHSNLPKETYSTIGSCLMAMRTKLRSRTCRSGRWRASLSWIIAPSGEMIRMIATGRKPKRKFRSLCLWSRVNWPKICWKIIK